MPRTAPRAARAPTRWPRTGTSGTSPRRGSRPERRSPSGPCRPGTGSSCSGTGLGGCTTTSGWRWAGSWPAGPCRRAPRSTRRCAARRSTSRTTRSSTTTSRASSPRASTAAGTSSCGTPGRGTTTTSARAATRSTRWPTASCTWSWTGQKLKGKFVLVRTSVDDAGKESWLLLHKKDEFVRGRVGRGGASALGPVRPHQRRGQGGPRPPVALGPPGRPGRDRSPPADVRAGVSGRAPRPRPARRVRLGGRCSVATCG